MSDVSSLNTDQLLLSPTLSEGHEGAPMRRGPALEASISGAAGQTSPEGSSPLDRPAFRVTISREASLLAQGTRVPENSSRTGRAEGLEATGGSKGETESLEDGKREGRVGAEADGSSRGRETSDADRREVEKLEKEDRRVRQHEQAHMASGGRYARGGAKYEYTTGPDGKRYATGGEVSIDLSAEKDPRATIQKMNTVRRAALAPADPSAADRSVAATATRKAAEARKQLSEDRKQEPLGVAGKAGGAGPVENPIEKTRAEPPSAPDSQANAVLRTGLLRAISSVTAPPPQSPGTVDRYV